MEDHCDAVEVLKVEDVMTSSWFLSALDKATEVDPWSQCQVWGEMNLFWPMVLKGVKADKNVVVVDDDDDVIIMGIIYCII